MLPISPRSEQGRCQQLLVAKLSQNHFLSRDLQDRLSVSAQELEASRASAGRLLGGGGRYRVYQGVLTLDPGKTFSTETNQHRGMKVYLKTDDTLDITVVYRWAFGGDSRVLYSGPYTGERNFGAGLELGHFQLTVKNSSDSPKSIYVHVEDEAEADCSIM